MWCSIMPRMTPGKTSAVVIMLVEFVLVPALTVAVRAMTSHSSSLIAALRSEKTIGSAPIDDIAA
jgi:hypothetical protein